MTTQPPMPDLFGRVTLVVGEHATVRSTIETLRQERGALLEAGGPPPPELAAEVNAFGELLLAHFATEERPEYFGALVEDSPELAEPINELKAEHREMERYVRQLEAAAGSHEGAAFAAQLGRLLDRIEAHERRESSLLARFFQGDRVPVTAG